ncbi:hypothetical protein [Pseudomonas akapageensis]|uniref:hypothetical protein n=1 Tax=Pseudomonas akapageensis TaxID=2609961 RepID=UPI00140962F8|nr:hypothetical protein [Pseudomonas akapageensis]
MTRRQRYKRKPDQYVTAVQLDLDTPGFTYRKWGAEQHCKRGDWLVNNAGETYTVDAQVFPRTYRQVGPGVYIKATPVWAEMAERAGSVRTKEGVSHFEAGDYLVFNDEQGLDGYCIKAERFNALYERDE